MEEEFVTYEQALALQELGFDWGTYEHYDSHTKEICDIMKHVRAPLKQQVFRWFREKCNLYSAVNVDQTTEPKFAYCISSYWHDALSWGWDTIVFNSDLYYEYEEAENACIDKLIEIVKQQDND
jgi:hypothetical protein